MLDSITELVGEEKEWSGNLPVLLYQEVSRTHGLGRWRDGGYAPDGLILPHASGDQSGRAGFKAMGRIPSEGGRAETGQ